jgi:hypothetical protein
VRIVFLDEAGISKREPWVVVAGIVVHGDTELIPLEEHLEELAIKHIPEADRGGFIFHMKEIWSGVKYYKDRNEWPIERRIEIMNDLAAIPSKFNLPIAIGPVEKAKAFSGKEHVNVEANSVTTHAVAFSLCTAIIEELMKRRWPDEIAQLVAEDNDQARALIREVHAFIRNPALVEERGLAGENYPLQRIRGGVQFADKSESVALQVADTCAFFVRGQLSGHPEIQQFFDQLRPMLVAIPKSLEGVH